MAVLNSVVNKPVLGDVRSTTGQVVREASVAIVTGPPGGVASCAVSDGVLTFVSDTPGNYICEISAVGHKPSRFDVQVADLPSIVVTPKA